MSMQSPDLTAHPLAEAKQRRHRYLRAPEPVYFPVSEKVPETNDNLDRRIALYQSARRELAARATIGSDQFVYYDPTNPKKNLAPDVFVRLGVPHRKFDVWNIWERGAPELGVEILSASDKRGLTLEVKLERYRTAGVGEVVAFDPRSQTHPIRVWDLVGSDQVERSSDDPDLRWCEALGLWWVVVEDAALGPTLRLAHDREGRRLLPTPTEAEAAAREDEAKARSAEAAAREDEAAARDAEAAAREEADELRRKNERLKAELAASRAQRAKPRRRRS